MSIRLRESMGSVSFGRNVGIPHWPRLAVFMLSLLCCFSGSALNAQTYLENAGVPTFTTKVPVENGFVNVANGNLHLEIPLGSYPQRAGAVDKVELMYDSAIWTPNLSTPRSWLPEAGFGEPYGGSYAYMYSGWRLATSGDVGTAVAGEYDYGWCSAAGDYYWATYSPWFWTAPDGTQHSFPASTNAPLYPTLCSGTGTPTSTAYASDGSGFYISISNYVDAVVYAPDGTKLDTYSYYDPGGSDDVKTDPNGNQYTISAGPIIVDTLNRSLVSISENSGGTEFYYDVPNAQGATSRYTVHLATIYWNTAFGQTGIGETSGSFQAPTEIDLPDGSEYLFGYDTGTSSSDTSIHYGLLTYMTLPTGGTINYTFNNFSDAVGNVYRWITKRTTPDSPSTGWTYSGPSVVTSCASGQVDCQQQVTVTKPSGDKSVYTFTLNGGAWPTQVQYENSSSSVLASTSACYTFASSCSYSVTTASPATDVYRIAETSTLGSVSSTTQYGWDTTNNNGNLLTLSEWNFGSSLSNPADRTTTISYLTGSSYGSANVLNRPTSITVTNSSSATVAKTVNCYDYASGCGGSSFASVSAVNHDSTYGTSYTARGDLTQVQRYTSTSNSLTSSMTYDITGQMLTSTDPAGNETTYGYSDSFYTDGGDGSTPSTYSPSSATNAYLTSVTQAYGTSVAETSTFGYYWGTGQMAASTDPNSRTTYSHFYDSLNRPTSIRYPDSGWNYFAYSGSTQIDEGSGITSTTETATSCSTSGNACRHDQTLMDSLGRVTSQILVSDPSGQDTIAATYDSNGRAYTVSNPYRSTSDPTYGLTTPTYDALDRITAVQDQDGSVAHTYYGTAVSGAGGSTSQSCSGYGVGYPILNVDEAGAMRESWMDGFGRMIEVDEFNSGTIATCYGYDLNNNLTSVVQNSSRTRSFSYDMLSRLTSAASPEQSGTTYYYYTASGGGLCAGDTSTVCRRTDARSITTTYSYDALSRLTGKSYSDGTTPAVTYSYDQSSVWGNSLSNPIGRLTFTEIGGVTTAELFSYDTMGRTVKHWQCVPGTCGYEFDYSYNLMGGVTSYDDSATGITFGQSYDSAGRVTQLTSSLTDAYHPGTLAAVNSYWPAGQTQKITLGNGLYQSALYEPRLQPCRNALYSSGTPQATCLDSPPSGNIQTFGYAYGTWGSSNNGNVTTWLGVGSQSFNRTYGYDTLNRLNSLSDSTSGNPCPGLSWSYDAWGNRTAQTVTSGTCGSWSTGYNSYNHITSTGFSYDAAGNMTNDGSHSYAYDAENQLISVDGGTTATYVYDAEGRRVQKTSGGVSTQYLYDLSGNTVVDYQSGGWFRTYIYLNNQFLAQYNAWGTTYFVFGDHLGTTRLMTDMTPSVADSMDYLPFGEQIAGSGTSTHQFTGYTRDSESDLDDAQARYYSSAQGRFMSPDPLGGDISDPQTLNRYGYVRNNPLNLTDPTGMQPSDGSDGGCIDGGDCGNCDVFILCGGGLDPEPVGTPSPVYVPGSGTDPNPPAGDPDPDGPFSGPIWQEGGPQIPTGNLAVLFGVPDPSTLIIDNFGDGTLWGHSAAWWKTFFSTFLANFGSLNFYGQEVSDGGCLNTFGRATLSALNPAGPSLASEAGAGTMAASAAMRYNTALEYAASQPNYLGGQGLLYLQKSKRFMKILKGSAVQNLAEGVGGYVDGAMLQGVISEAAAARNGACH